MIGRYWQVFRSGALASYQDPVYPNCHGEYLYYPFGASSLEVRSIVSSLDYTNASFGAYAPPINGGDVRSPYWANTARGSLPGSSANYAFYMKIYTSGWGEVYRKNLLTGAANIVLLAFYGFSGYTCTSFVAIDDDHAVCLLDNNSNVFKLVEVDFTADTVTQLYTWTETPSAGYKYMHSIMMVMAEVAGTKYIAFQVHERKTSDLYNVKRLKYYVWDYDSSTMSAAMTHTLTDWDAAGMVPCTFTHGPTTINGYVVFPMNSQNGDQHYIFLDCIQLSASPSLSTTQWTEPDPQGTLSTTMLVPNYADDTVWLGTYKFIANLDPALNDAESRILVFSPSAGTISRSARIPNDYEYRDAPYDDGRYSIDAIVAGPVRNYMISGNRIYRYSGSGVFLRDIPPCDYEGLANAWVYKYNHDIVLEVDKRGSAEYIWVRDGDTFHGYNVAGGETSFTCPFTSMPLHMNTEESFLMLQGTRLIGVVNDGSNNWILIINST